MEKTKAELIAELTATFEKAKAEANAVRDGLYVVAGVDDLLPVKHTDGRGYAFYGVRIATFTRTAAADLIASDFNRQLKAKGSTSRVKCMAVASWRAAHNAKMDEHIAYLIKHK